MSELSVPLRDALRPAKLCSEAQLARRAAAGDPRAFTEIFRRHHQAIYRYCRSIVRNDEDAADALQSTMAAALRGLDGETREIALKPWLFRVAHNESLSLLRRRRPDGELREDLAAAAGGPEARALASERLRQVVDDIQALPDRQRGALVMRELSGLEYGQIAAAFGVGEGAARQAVYEAREMLHEIAEGRAMACAEVRKLISARDGRLLRGRKVRAHLRACAGCAEFRAAIGQRCAALAAIAPPLPAAVGASILQGLLGGGGSGGGGLAVGGSATTASAAAGCATTAKSLAGVGLLAQGSATAGLVTKAAVVVAVSATLTGGGVAARQQLQRDTPQPPPAAGSRVQPDVPSARPATAVSAVRTERDAQATAHDFQARERALDDAARATAASAQPRERAVEDAARSTAAGAVGSPDGSVQPEAAGSRRPVTQSSRPAPSRDANAGGSAAGTGTPATGPTAPAQRPASAQSPDQATAAAPLTAPSVAPSRPAPSAPLAASADGPTTSPVIAQTPESTLSRPSAR